MESKTYYWDFFGPNADGTAAHFLKHLAEFLSKHGIDDCGLDLCSEGMGHRAARCVAPQAAQAVIEGSLRPQRAEP